MSTKKISLHKIILIAIGAITVAMCIVLFIYPPALFPDPSHGFQVMRSMQMGGGFNQFISPDQDDISKNTSEFLTWWSPGQYLVPYFFSSVFSMNTGHASALAISIAEISGLAGFYFFFKRIGFSSLISAISLLFIICQVAFIIPYIFYNGGEVLLFGFEGWFLYGCTAIQKPGLKSIAFVLFAGWIGFFCKSSFVWIYAAGLLCIWIRLSGRTGLYQIIRNGLWIGIPAILSMATIYIFFLSKGNNPASVSTGLKLSWQAFCFPLGSPLLSGFSVDDLFQGLVNHPAFSLCVIVAILLLLTAFSLILIAAIINYTPNYNYKVFIIVFYSVAILFFTTIFLRGLNISYEARHLRVIGLLIVPGVIYLFSKFKPAYQALLGIVCLGLAFMSYSFLVKGYKFNINVSARGNSGMAQEYIDQPSLNYIMALDRQSRNAVFVFITTDLGLEIIHNRVITLDLPNPNVKFGPDDFSYDGHAGPVYMLLPASFSGKNAAMLESFFPGYSGFTQKSLSRNYVLYSAK